MSAYVSFHPVKRSDFSSERLADRYDQIMKRLTTVTPDDPNQGIVPATVHQLDDEEAREIAEMVWSLTYDLLAERD